MRGGRGSWWCGRCRGDGCQGNVADKHFSIVLPNEAVADVVNAHARPDISQAWGDGTAVAAEGTHMDTYLDNLLSETSVRYGKPGGIVYHHVSDTYIALVTHFIPCGVWEAVQIIEGLLKKGLLKNTSEVQPTTVHADTQGQSFPVFALAHLLGFDLMPRIRNWKELTFYRPSKQSEYVHIDALFGEPGQNIIDFGLIESQFRHLMRVAVSVQPVRRVQHPRTRHPARGVRPETRRRLHPAARAGPDPCRPRQGRLNRGVNQLVTPFTVAGRYTPGSCCERGSASNTVAWAGGPTALPWGRRL
ncbi:Tn3 family transposase [Streptomyces mutomycini]|uniref:Tn3 family transposase n=1 Tax=Streptomyces mutomycini TaxID=284036 RepID=UPI0033E2402D